MKSSTSSAKAVWKPMIPNSACAHTKTAYGVVYRAKERQTSRVVALKQLRISAEERKDGIPVTTLREISILRSLKHRNIINVMDVAVGERAMDEVYMIMEYAEQVGDPVSMVKT